MADNDPREESPATSAAEGHKLPTGVKLVRCMKGHDGAVMGIAFDPSGETLASGSRDTSIKLWRVKSGDLLLTFKGHRSPVTSIAFGMQGKYLASGSLDGTMKLWDPTNGRMARTIESTGGQVWSIAFDIGSETLAGGAHEGEIEVWEASSDKHLWTRSRRGGAITGIAMTPDGSTLASACADGEVTLWGASSGSWYAEMVKSEPSITWSVAFDPKGEILAGANEALTITLWDADTHKHLRTLEGHIGSIDAVAFSADGRLLASKSEDDTIRLWDCETWKTVAVIRNPTRRDGWYTPALAFHPTLPLLAAGGTEWDISKGRDSHLISLWELDVDQLTAAQDSSAVTYTSAKVVLVGESNVGKSYLAHRIATGMSPEHGTIDSTHGMRFWPLEPAEVTSTPVLPAGRLFGPEASSNRRERRDIVLWDMGGQEEYRLVHQLFLHDTTVALVLLDPTRGASAFKEVEAWNKSLEKQLGGRAAMKLLVGAKVDKPSDMVDRQALERLRKDCGFAAYIETSAVSGRGIEELCEELAKAIDWDNLSKTTRPELFQAIRDELEQRRKGGSVVVLFDQFYKELYLDDESATCVMIPWELVYEEPTAAVPGILDAVCGQLARQGIIARAKTSSGQSALILRIEEVERYAGSLILAAKRNQRDRGVPALELRAIAQEQFQFPQIRETERLPRADEKAVVECTVQLMLEHGICFQHEGLLIFPSLFASAVAMPDEKLPHTVSLYYDFAGAIDNIYASLVAWLVLATEFGKVRLWEDRAEFELQNGGLCGLRKVARPGGFAHVDVYFEKETPQQKQSEFISFVEDHLRRNGIEIKEQIVVDCPQGFIFDPETIQMRIAAGDKEVLCPRCNGKHSLTEGAVQVRERDAKIAAHTWALRTEIEKRREMVAAQVVKTLGVAEEAAPPAGPIRLLHLSDLHFTKDTPVSARLQWLLDDLKQDGGLGFKELDYLVISGDFTDKGRPEGFEKAYDFVSELTREFGLSAERCVFVPGNHDVHDLEEAYGWKSKVDGLKPEEWVKQGEIYLARNPDKYPLRMKPFSDSFYHKFLQRPYPQECNEQGISIPFWETGIQFLTLNSCHQIDQFYRKRSGVHAEAVASVIRQAQKQETEARKLGLLAEGASLLRIAVWHHAVGGPEQMRDTSFVGNLLKGGVKLALHGDVHEMVRDQVGYEPEEGIHIVGSGSFGAPATDRPEAMPRLYNVLEIARDLKSVRVHTRRQQKPDGAWDGWHEWRDPKEGGKGRVPYYDIKF